MFSKFYNIALALFFILLVCVFLYKISSKNNFLFKPIISVERVIKITKRPLNPEEKRAQALNLSKQIGLNYRSKSKFPESKKLLKYSNKVSSYSPEDAFNGFTLYPQIPKEIHKLNRAGGRSQKRKNLLKKLASQGGVSLVNMEGELVHSWPIFVSRARLLPNCNLLTINKKQVMHFIDDGTLKKLVLENGFEEFTPDALAHFIFEFDWEGRIVWSHKAPTETHHDVRMIDDEHLIFIREGNSFSPQLKKNIYDLKRRSIEIRGDIVEIIKRDSTVVWSWEAHKHLDINSCGKYSCSELQENARKYNTRDRNKVPGDWNHINSATVLGANKWYKAGDHRFHPDNVLISIRNWSTVMIIDRITKKTVWSYQGSFNGGISAQHEAEMISPWLLGAGNILLFDNGIFSHPEESYVLEIDPGNKKVNWLLGTDNKLYNDVRSGAQRLINGNTLVSLDMSRQILEFNRKKKLVWKYRAKSRDITFRWAKRYPGNYCKKFSQFLKS